MNNAYVRAAAGAILVGAGIVLILSATKLMDPPCIDCGEAEEVAAEVAQASAEIAEEE